MNRRSFLKLARLGGVLSVGGLLAPAWIPQARAVRSIPRHAPAQHPAIPAGSSTPAPLGPTYGPDGRPVVYDLDFGSVSALTSMRFVLSTGAGPRVIRIKPGCTVWIEGKTLSFSDGLVRVGDKVQVSGTTLMDMSLECTHCRVNSIENMRGIISSVDSGNLNLWRKQGRISGDYDANPVSLLTLKETKIFSGFANYSSPNATLAEAHTGAWVMVDGYFQRDGTKFVLDVFLGNGLPPDDTPDWIARQAKSRT